MARVTSTALFFSTGNEITSKNWIYPSGTVKVFYQASAPTGWTKSTAHDDKALRIVSGSGGGSGGSISFSSAFVNFSVSGPFSTSDGTGNATPWTPNEIPNHTHDNGGELSLAINPINPAGAYTGGDVRAGAGWTRNSPGTGNVNGTGPQQHAHPFSYSGTTPAQPLNLNVNYVDMIICSYNG